MKKILTCLFAALGLTTACGQQNFENYDVKEFAELEHSNEWDSPYKQFSVLHTCNDPDGDKRSLPDAGTPPALCPDEDDDGNTALSSCGLSASLAQSCSFHSLFKLDEFQRRGIDTTAVYDGRASLSPIQ